MTKILPTCECCNPKNIKVSQKYVKVLSCPCRWKIIDIIGNKTKSTKQIYEELKQHGEDFTMQGLYYHLSELKKVGIIDVHNYKEGQGAPEKIWKLKTKTIKIDLVK